MPLVAWSAEGWPADNNGHVNGAHAGLRIDMKVSNAAQTSVNYVMSLF